MAEPVERAKAENGIDEVGVYRRDDGWIELIYYDHQGNATMEFPEELRAPLAAALEAAAPERPEFTPRELLEELLRHPSDTVATFDRAIRDALG